MTDRPGVEQIGWEEFRKQNGWPTPNHMRRAADALDMLTPAKYGDVLRWVADACDDALDRAATPAPSEPRLPVGLASVVARVIDDYDPSSRSADPDVALMFNAHRGELLDWAALQAPDPLEGRKP